MAQGKRERLSTEQRIEIREQTSARSAVRQGDFHAYACFIYSRKIGYRDLTQRRPLNPIMNMPDITIYKIGI